MFTQPSPCNGGTVSRPVSEVEHWQCTEVGDQGFSFSCSPPCKAALSIVLTVARCGPRFPVPHDHHDVILLTHTRTLAVPNAVRSPLGDTI